jgi:hypothetical protein
MTKAKSQRAEDGRTARQAREAGRSSIRSRSSARVSGICRSRGWRCFGYCNPGWSRFHLRLGYDGRVALDPGLISGTAFGVLSQRPRRSGNEQHMNQHSLRSLASLPCPSPSSRPFHPQHAIKSIQVVSSGSKTIQDPGGLYIMKRPFPNLHAGNHEKITRL